MCVCVCVCGVCVEILCCVEMYYNNFRRQFLPTVHINGGGAGVVFYGASAPVSL